MLDLTKYVGKNIQIEFYFFSNCGTSSAGWFVDDLELLADEYPSMGFESFECGWGDWSATRGNWQVGKPQNGPGRAWSGTNCAGVVLGGNYPNNVSSSLLSPLFGVPGTNQNPRLRFMHWFSIDLGNDCSQGPDYGQVYVRLPDGTREAISPAYYATSDWTPTSLNLTKYAGKIIRIEFYFFSNCGTSSSGWFIDDVELRTSDLQFLARLDTGDGVLASTEGFERGWGDWSATRGNWRVGKPQNGRGHAASGTNCAGVVLSGYYPNNISSSLLTPRFLVPSAIQNPRLRFMHWFSVNAGNDCSQGPDYGQAKVRLPDGTEESFPDQYFGSSDWTPASLSLTSYAGRSVQIEFYFFSNCGTSSSGWFIDDVQILPSLVNAPPKIAAITSQVARADVLLTFPVIASDPNAGQIITYSVDTDTAPAGASIDPVTGVFSWTPRSDQLRTNGYYVTVRATDNGQPRLTASSVVPIIVADGPHLISSLEAGGAFHITIPDTISGFDYTLEASSDLMSWQEAISFTQKNRGEPQCYQTAANDASPHLFFRLKAAPSQP